MSSGHTERAGSWCPVDVRPLSPRCTFWQRTKVRLRCSTHLAHDLRHAASARLPARATRQEQVMTLRILIVEDHPLFADALGLVIAQSFSGIKIHKAHSIGTALEAIRRDGPFDIVLLDLWLSDSHGLEGLLTLRSRHPKLPILVVSGFACRDVADRVMACGASGIISKTSDQPTLTRAIERVLEGGQYFAATGERSGQAEAIDCDPLDWRFRMLTQQQIRVLHMLSQGLLNKQIAHELNVGETTVKAHVSEILRKLNVSSRTQAVLEVSKLDLGAQMLLRASRQQLGPVD